MTTNSEASRMINELLKTEGKTNRRPAAPLGKGGAFTSKITEAQRNLYDALPAAKLKSPHTLGDEVSFSDSIDMPLQLLVAVVLDWAKVR